MHLKLYRQLWKGVSYPEVKKKIQKFERSMIIVLVSYTILNYALWLFLAISQIISECYGPEKDNNGNNVKI